MNNANDGVIGQEGWSTEIVYSHIRECRAKSSGANKRKKFVYRKNKPWHVCCHVRGHRNFVECRFGGKLKL